MADQPSSPLDRRVRELRTDWEEANPFAPSGWAPDFRQQAARELQAPSGAMGAQAAPAKPPTAAELQDQFDRERPFASASQRPDFEAIADQALDRYERQSAALRAVAPGAPGGGQYDAENEQLWAAVRKLQAGSGGGGGGGGGVTPPHWLEQVDDTHVKVRFGTISGIVPTNNNTSLDVGSADGTWAIYYEATLDSGGNVTGVTAIADDGGSVPADDSTTTRRLIGEVDVSDGVIAAVRANMAWPLIVVVCGRDPEDPSSTPGTYYWELGT